MALHLQLESFAISLSEATSSNGYCTYTCRCINIYIHQNMNLQKLWIISNRPARTSLISRVLINLRCWNHLGTAAKSSNPTLPCYKFLNWLMHHRSNAWAVWGWTECYFDAMIITKVQTFQWFKQHLRCIMVFCFQSCRSWVLPCCMHLKWTAKCPGPWRSKKNSFTSTAHPWSVLCLPRCCIYKYTQNCDWG